MSPVLTNPLAGLVWMQKAISQSGKSRYWIVQRCNVYRVERRHYVKQTELDKALQTYQSLQEVSTPLEKNRSDEHTG